ncbi:hypothetical protein [Neorhodopirellula pilleata]|uniref:Uncharacterized protein n=1 Tax=Neorhodopirellula pilleata TaxID=2714738 RepID=A0A5C6A0L5_9BACT|nr:hypothetical protein [Neorhodopirellula pilleata]TWT92956.1 hypothetical protein Pla100_42720 [Neorhodopirellula pilleata]
MTSHIPHPRFSGNRPSATGSLLVVRQLLDQADGSFLDELCRIEDADKLGSFAREFLDDRRSHVRAGLLAYIDVAMSQYRHEALVKRLFKLAEAASDDEVMARFMVALDRSVRREVRTRRSWDWVAREATEETYIDKRDQSMPRSDREASAKARNRRAVKQSQWQLFSAKTRDYLRRRAWRYFRTLAKIDATRYRTAMSEALVQYTDDDTADGLALIDNWSLMHVLFHGCDQIVAEARGWTLAENGSLEKLLPAPYLIDIWKSDAEALLDLVGTARARAVRMWSMQMLQSHHQDALAQLPLKRILAWIRCDDDEIASLAADSLNQHGSVTVFSAEQWIEILDHANASVLVGVCETARQKANVSTWTTEECLAVAMRRPDPIAALAIGFLADRTVESAAQAEQWLSLGDSECVGRRGELVGLALRKVAASEHFEPVMLTLIVDSTDETVRAAGLAFLTQDERTENNVTLWQRLLESPHDDVQLTMTGLLQKQSLSWTESKHVNAASLDSITLTRLWATVLLNTRRGGKIKLQLIEQIGRLITKHPDRSDVLLPLLKTSLRSVRATEFRCALTTVVGLMDQSDEITSYFTAEVPELLISSPFSIS